MIGSIERSYVPQICLCDILSGPWCGCSNCGGGLAPKSDCIGLSIKFIL